MYLIKEKNGTAACQLESIFRLFENWSDVVDTHDCRAKFLKNCVRAFGDKSRQSCLATTRWAPQDDAPQSTFLDEGGEERIGASQMHLANKLVQCIWPESLG